MVGAGYGHGYGHGGHGGQTAMVGALANCLRTGKWRSVPLLVAPSPARGHRPRKGLADAGHVPAKDWSFTPPPRYQDALQEWASGEFDALRIGLDKVMADGGGSSEVLKKQRNTFFAIWSKARGGGRRSRHIRSASALALMSIPGRKV